MDRRHALHVLGGALASAAAFSSTPTLAATALALPLYAPANLAARIADVTSGKLAVVHVGRASLFRGQHIPGSSHAGDASTPAGRESLLALLRALPSTMPTILYCGCCPLDHCAFIRPAEEAARASGRAKTFVLDLATNFDRDWVAKGYPVTRG
ncbi:MAG: hypothetical protein JWM74_1701 [Myxococcaceae bacterium]|nr:hypothetical protein [Myxococcaceae bacterium]